MAITVLEVLNIDGLENLNLVAGENGLDGVVKKVGILDYEFLKKVEGQFGEGDFIITSFLFAKDDVNLLIDSIKNLVKDKVTCLAIKNVYYTELPSEIIQYADEKSFPIFIFDNSILYEDMITDITDMIRTDAKNQLIEDKIDRLLHENIGKDKVKEIGLGINKDFKDKFLVIYCSSKKDDKDFFWRLHRYKHSRNKSDIAFKYKAGIMGIITRDRIEDNNIDNLVYELLSDLGISSNDFHIGVSKAHGNLDVLDIGVRESLYALSMGKISSKDIVAYDSIGIYKILLPFQDEYWVKDFYQSLIIPLQNYDKKNSSEMFKTAIIYIENGGNIKAASEKLFQHENTIRYRINKIKEILNIKDNQSFNEELSLAIKIYKILKNK